MSSTGHGSFGRLLARARSGSKSALGRLLDLQRGWLKGKAAWWLGRDLARKGDASDLVQDCQLSAVNRFADFHGKDPRSWRAWLRIILKRKFVKFLRKWRGA